MSCSSARIFCLKVRQRLVKIRLHKDFKSHKVYTPFERLYLIPPDLSKKLPHLFRYYFQLELEPLFDTLNQYGIGTQYYDALDREHTAAVKTTSTRSGPMYLSKIIEDPRGWQAVVPTYVRTHIVAQHDNGRPIPRYSSYVAYLFSQYAYRDGVIPPNLPSTILLHTPDADYPYMCVACPHMADHMAGDCKPISTACNRNLASGAYKLPHDPSWIPKQRRKNARIQRDHPARN